MECAEDEIHAESAYMILLNAVDAEPRGSDSLHTMPTLMENNMQIMVDLSE